MGIERIYHTRLGDTSPAIALSFSRDGTLIDWATEGSGISDVTFSAWALGTETPTINAAAAFTDANGVLTYQRVAGDFAARGRYVGRYSVTYVGGRVESFPPTSDFVIQVH